MADMQDDTKREQPKDTKSLPFASVFGIDFDPSKFTGDFNFLVDTDTSLPIPKTSTEVIETPRSWIFPEDVEFYNHGDVYLYALGIRHVWRTTDVNSGWELVK